VKREPRTARERALLLLEATLIPGWLPPTSSGQRLISAIRIAIVLVVLLLISSAVDKPLWSWLQLLIVPAVLAIGGYWFNRQQQNREFAIAEQRTQDEVLQGYLDQMSQLLTDKELRSKTHWLDDVRVTARARSLAALARLDGERKKSLLQFLYEAQLINKDKMPLRWEEAKELGPDGPTQFDARIVGLSGADLTSADLRYITLSNAALNGAFLDNADLRRAKLNGVDLGGAYLSGADLRDADLRGALLVNADLQQKDALNLSSADLSGADLKDADLTGADLRGVNGVTKEKLKALAKSLKGAAMPDESEPPERSKA
jgi:hypothetical protein